MPARLQQATLSVTVDFCFVRRAGLQPKIGEVAVYQQKMSAGTC